MYKATLRAVVRHTFRRMNDGDPTFALRLAAPDAVIAFPGDNTWSTMFRRVEGGRRQHATHRGFDECRAFAERFCAAGIQFDLEDILVNGPPWNTRVAIRANDFIRSEDGYDYTNRVVAFLTIRWGRICEWEDYEDTVRLAEWDQRRREASSTESSAHRA